MVPVPSTDRYLKLQCHHTSDCIWWVIWWYVSCMVPYEGRTSSFHTYHTVRCSSYLSLTLRSVGLCNAQHPHIVAGAIASSAPIMQFTGLVGDNIFAQLVTRDYQRAGCSGAIRRSWDILLEMSMTQPDRNTLSDIFQLCSPLTKQEDIGTMLFNMINSAWQYMAMADYPV
jgi:hypothetical protein